jgi:tetratricopeptide (TPR) repeat protein
VLAQGENRQDQRRPRDQYLKYWYKAAELSPWLTGKMLKNLKLFTDDWRQVIDTDPDTGKEQIFITCSYRPSNTSFFIVVDPESKLIRRAKLWKNLEWKGRPGLDAQTFIYNQEIADEVFEIPSGMTIVNEKDIEDSQALFNQGEHLFHKEKKYAEAMGIYQQVYDRFPKLNTAEEALMMIGICHGRLGQPDKAIEAFQKAISEYPHLKGWIDATYFYLGCAYTDQGQKEKALEAFENCLSAGEGVRDPDKFPLKPARENIEKLKNQE